MAKAVLKEKFDTEEFGDQKSLLQILTYGNGEPNFEQEKLLIKGVDKLIGMVDVYEDIKTSIVTLNINASEPKLAMEINKVLIERLDAHQRNYNKAKTSDTKHFIEGRIVDTENELITAEENLRFLWIEIVVLKIRQLYN